MFRSSRRYQKQARDELRRQNGTTTALGRASYGLRMEAARMEAEKAARIAGESLSEELERLSRLHDQGVLTSAEFEQAKARVLNRP